jgi:hypothetical protein
MDFLPGGDLLEALLRTPAGRFSENEARVYIAEIVTVGGSGCLVVAVAVVTVAVDQL